MSIIRTILALISLVLAAALSPQAQAADTPESKLAIITISGHANFTVEVPKTQKEKERGLMYRTSLAADRGMLFYWDKPTDIKMWMKNTKISLDMLFIDDKGSVVYIAADTQPESTDMITANRPVSAVLELAGGTAAADNIHIGDSVVHTYFHHR